MSYSIIKKVRFKGDGVYITSASNNVYPRTYDEFRSDYYSTLLQEKGFREVAKQFADSLHDGNRFLKGNKFCNCMLEAQKELDVDKSLFYFLDRDTYSNYIADSVVAKYNRVPFEDKQERINKLIAMRKDPETVFTMCKDNARAFFCSDPSIQSNKELCKRYVKEFASNLMFDFPPALFDDKESALIAVTEHGCALRDLSSSMREDKDIVLAAFGAKKYPEHLPDIISPALQEDVEFMKQLIDVQPRIHSHRSPSMLNNPDIVLKLAEKSEWISDFKSFPEGIRDLPQIQRAMAARIRDDLHDVMKDVYLQILSEVVQPVYLVAEQLKDAAGLEYKGIVFDDFAVSVSDDCPGIWAEMCQCCAEKYKDILADELDDAGGIGVCSVAGCSVSGMSDEYEHHYYVDFKPELIKPLSREELLVKQYGEVLIYDETVEQGPSPQVCANALGKPVITAEEIFIPETTQAVQEHYTKKPALGARIDNAAKRSNIQDVSLSEEREFEREF